MPIKETFTMTRASKDVVFQSDDNFWDSADTVSYIANVYESSGKLLATSCDKSDDLTLVWVDYWDTMESMIEFEKDPFFAQGRINQTGYRDEKNIETESTIEEVSIDSVPVGVFFRK
jgi:hypothetical protein